MPRALQPVSAGILPAPASPVSHLSQRSGRSKKAAASEQTAVASPLQSSGRSKKRREPSALEVRSQDSEVEEEKTPQRKAPDARKRRNSTRLQSVATRCGDGQTRSSASEEDNASAASRPLPSSLSSLTKRTSGGTRGAERDDSNLQSGQSAPACTQGESQPSDSEAAESPPRRVTRQTKEDSSYQKAGWRRSMGEGPEAARAEPGGRGGRSVGDEQAEARRETRAPSDELARLAGGRANRQSKGGNVGEEEVEMTSPRKRREEGQSSEPEEAAQEGWGKSVLEIETEEDVELKDLEDQIEKFESALTLLRPTVGDYAGEREESVQAISSHIDKLLARKRGGMVYLCGASGTGKTCTALHVLDQKLKEAKHRSKIHKELVTVSCAHREKDAQLFCEMLVRMLPPSNLPSERALYSDLKAALMKEGIGGLVTRFTNFTKKSDKLWLCLVDEVDFLTTTGKIRADVRDSAGRASGGGAGVRGHGGGSGAASQRSALQQDILMALALAATHPHSKIVVVAISNSSELAQHFAGLPVPSLTFCPYTERQLTSLLLKRQVTLEVLGGQKCFAAPAILVFARKAANTYGDFRMALSGFCRAIEDKLGSLHDERARALLAAAARSRSRSSLCSTAAPPSRSMTGEASVDSADFASVQDSSLSSKSRRPAGKSSPAEEEVAPSAPASASPPGVARSKSPPKEGKDPREDESETVRTDLGPCAAPAAVLRAKRRASSAFLRQTIALPSRKEEGEPGFQQTPTPSFSGVLSQSVLTGETPQHLQQTSPSTAASTSSFPSPLTSGSSCHSPGTWQQTAGGRKNPEALRKAAREGQDAINGDVSARGDGDTRRDTEGSGRNTYTEVNSPHSWLGSPLLHASSDGESSHGAHFSLARRAEAEKRQEEGDSVREEGATEDAEEKERVRHRQSCGGRRRESVRESQMVSADVSPCGSPHAEEPKLSQLSESRVRSQSRFLPSLSPSVRHFRSGGEAHLAPSAAQPLSLGSCPASFFSPSPPSPLSLSSFSSTASTPPPSPFPGGSGQRRRTGSQLSALKLLQLQEPAGNGEPTRRPSSSSGYSPSRSLGLRDIQNLKNGAPKPPSLHLIAASRGSHSSLSSRDPSRSGEGRCALRSTSDSGESSRPGRDGGAEGKLGTALAGEGENDRCGSLSGDAPHSKKGRASVSQVIGVGEMNARAGAVFGNDQQNVVARIQGLPLMHQVYLLAACRSALKRVHEAQSGGQSGGTLPAGTRDCERGTEGGFRGGGRHSQQENVSTQQKEQLLGCGGSVDITFTDVEVQYRQLCEELQNGYLLSQHMATSCWRHALEAFEQMGLMRPKRPGVLGSTAANGFAGLSGAVGGGSSLSSPLKGRLWGGPGSARGGFGPFGGGARRSSSGLFVGMGGGAAGAGGGFKTKLAAEREQAWELQLSPALIEAAIKRLQPILMSSDLEEHFTRGLEA
ncbi:conserved hypothetical protein [Neospora caninum Liverpool]|uniref:ORC1/DEAH AAA+ ATPase domain-containing protein n=1 Tax=Neospora caninum (strain Liverpool) TaxID=572307 RepID=F0VGE8_NEOCL|nr:conserved hypothetical protein [Neospora caninum Liverpool]CBZ52792.1 conserved hypothetical protein [Neospora caninum Liverpool]CEL66774.1 TPA: hypothetical protein BN1204_025800 [Neospora caninum Liverpool]|eukprot:XP_003882824.1 conserved hypothetical protein [Neospora caninum Liverpool]